MGYFLSEIYMFSYINRVKRSIDEFVYSHPEYFNKRYIGEKDDYIYLCSRCSNRYLYFPYFLKELIDHEKLILKFYSCNVQTFDKINKNYCYYPYNYQDIIKICNETLDNYLKECYKFLHFTEFDIRIPKVVLHTNNEKLDFLTEKSDRNTGYLRQNCRNKYNIGSSNTRKSRYKTRKGDK